jgi:hypothetical protein
MTRGAPFSWQRRGEQLVLSGALDERASLNDLVREARDGRLLLDLGGITFINSIGVREWVHLQTAAAAARVRLELHRVAEPLVHQFNIVRAALKASEVRSFYATYLCDRCDEEEHLILLEVEALDADDGKVTPPSVACPQCRRPLEISNPPELYFTFLTGGPR